MISLRYLFEEGYGVRPDMIKTKTPRIPVQPAPGSRPPVEDKKKKPKPFKFLKFKSTTLSGSKYKPPKPFKADDRAAGGFPGVGRMT